MIELTEKRRVHEKTYSKDFKIKACEPVLKDNIAVAVASERFGIINIMLHKWGSEHRNNGK